MSSDRFIRWQQIRIEQFTFVNNLFTGLATGLLAFQTQLAFDDKTSLQAYEKLLATVTILLILASLIVGCCIAWIRLIDFRATAQKIRAQETDPENLDDIKALDKKMEKLGNSAWKLLPFQMILLAFGGLGLTIAAIIRYWQ